MYVTLSSYLRQLQVEQKGKPEEERLSVPTMRTLAEVAGIKPSSLSFIVNGRTRSFNFEACASIITYMRRCGFDTKITDIFRFEMPGESKGRLPPGLIRRQRLKGKKKPKRPPPPPLTRAQHRKYPGEEFVKAYTESEPTPLDLAAKAMPEESAIFASEGADADP